MTRDPVNAIRRMTGVTSALVLAAMTCAAVLAGTPAIASAPPGPPLRLGERSDADRTLITKLLDSPHWPFRVFALLRLDRFEGPERDALIRARIEDASWQVRCFAIRGAHRATLELSPDQFDTEADGRVMRTALRHGYTVDAEVIERRARALLRNGDLDDLLLGLELTAMTDQPALRGESIRRTRRLVRHLNDTLVVRYGDRIARLLGVDPAPANAAEWHAWLQQARRTVALTGDRREPMPPTGPLPIAADLDAEAFSRLVDYLDVLRQQDLELAIVMDATMSMVPMIDEARSGVDTLILFLADISRTMRVALVAYRDHDNAPVWEGHPFTNDVKSIREFLYNVRITGGRDLPEAVFEGLDACTQLDWSRAATRQIVLVGDAQPHDEDGYRITGLLETFRNSEVAVHAAHVPMRMNERARTMMTPAQIQARETEISEHNVRTRAAFTEIAQLGGGELVLLARAEDLVPSIMHLTIAETWWPAFDEFYAMYLDLCR